MGVAEHTYDAAMVESALFRSGGVALENYAYGPATNPDPSAGFRKYKAQGKGVGHVYIHIQGGGSDTAGHGAGLSKKSRYADRATAIGALVEGLKHPFAVQALNALDANPGSQQWLHGASGVPLTGAFYGYAQNEDFKRKIVTISMNLRSHGDALFISSSYPEDFQIGPVPNVI